MHAFGKNPVLIWILSTLLVVTAVGSAALIIWRWRQFDSHDEVESALSRDFLYYVTNLLLTLFAVAIAFATVVVPLIMERTVGASTYDVVARPLGVVILAMIAVCPLLAWRKTDGAQLRKTLILPTVTMLVSAPLWLYLGFQSNVWGFIGMLVCGFAFGAVIQFVLRSARRAAGPDGSLWSGLGRAFTGSRTRTAAYIVHMGMVLVVAGLLGSTVYKVEQSTIVKVKPGETASLNGYTLTYKGMEESTGAQNSTRAVATFDVTRDGQSLGTLGPHTDVYPGERCGGAGGHPRSPVRGPVRRRRRAVRRHVQDHRPAHGDLPAHPLGVDRRDPALRRRRRLAVAEAPQAGAGGARRRDRRGGRRHRLTEAARCRTNTTGRTARPPSRSRSRGCARRSAAARCSRASRSACRAAGSSASSAPTGPARPRPCACSPRCSRRAAARVKVAGHDVREDPMPVRRAIGFISHNAMLYPDLTAQENLRFYADMYGVEDREARITELLERLELSARRYDVVRTYSKGMRQRLAIARAILHRPRVLLLDEPHSGLDPRAVDILDGLLTEIRAEHTFVMVTHNIAKGLEWGTDLMIIESGRIAYEHAAGVDHESFSAVYREHVHDGSVA